MEVCKQLFSHRLFLAENEDIRKKFEERKKQDDFKKKVEEELKKIHDKKD